jgi:YidC/Oxa1 family membrane protein insertase
VNPLQLIEEPLRALLDFLHDNMGLSYGWAIVVLTVLVRTALLPLVIKQYRSMRQMQLVAPQLKELQRKHKGDRAKTQEELMKFYRENNINPFASCLPLLAQLPIFIALFYVLRTYSREAQEVAGESVSFMWLISDIRIDFQELGWVAVVPLLAIYALSQLLSTELSATPNMPDSQRRLMRVLPFVVVIFVVNFPVPAGLVLYWMSTNLWTCGQQLVMRHRIGMHIAQAPSTASSKRTSRTPPREATAAGLVHEEGGPEAGGADAGGADAPAEAPEALTAPEATDAGAPVEAPDGEAPPGPPVEAVAGGSSPPRSGGGKRRRPRPSGAGVGSRPAQARRSPKKRKKR